MHTRVNGTRAKRGGVPLYGAGTSRAAGRTRASTAFGAVLRRRFVRAARRCIRAGRRGVAVRARVPVRRRLDGPVPGPRCGRAAAALLGPPDDVLCALRLFELLYQALGGSGLVNEVQGFAFRGPAVARRACVERVQVLLRNSTDGQVRHDGSWGRDGAASEWRAFGAPARRPALPESRALSRAAVRPARLPAPGPSHHHPEGEILLGIGNNQRRTWSVV